MPSFLEFEVKRNQVPLRLTLPGDTPGAPDETHDYVVQELDGTSRDAYLNTMGSRVKVNPKTGTATGIKNFTGLQASLVHRCIFACQLVENPNYDPAAPADSPEANKYTVTPGSVADTHLSEKEVQAWPAGMQAQLHSLCTEMNQLGKGEEEGDEGED